jgi:hypothetical protein
MPDMGAMMQALQGGGGGARETFTEKYYAEYSERFRAISHDLSDIAFGVLSDIAEGMRFCARGIALYLEYR